MSWALILSMGLTAFILRSFFFFWMKEKKAIKPLPEKFVNLLELVPYAVFWAMIIPAILPAAEPIQQSLTSTAFYAVAVTFVLSYLLRPEVGILGGVAIYLLLSFSA